MTLPPKKVIYVAGPYRAPTEWGVHENIRRAEEVAISLWKMGYVVICPHKNTAHWGGILPDEVWLEGDLEILSRCDAVLAMKNFDRSVGAMKEIAFAAKSKIPIFYEGEVKKLETFLKESPDEE